MEKFNFKIKNKDIYILPKTNNFDEVIEDLYSTVKKGQNFFGNINKFILIWNTNINYEKLNQLQKENIYVEIFKEKEIEEIKKDIKSPLIIKRTIRGGEKVIHDDDIIIDGNINNESYIISKQDIYILGNARGIIHAGYPDNLNAKIVSLSCNNCQVRIGNYVKIIPQNKYKKPIRIFFNKLKNDIDIETIE